MNDRERWHLGEAAVYEYIDRGLSPAAMADADRHLRSCPACAGQLRRARLLFRRLESAEAFRLDRDLSANIVASLQAERASRRLWNRILLTEAVLAAAALAVLSIHFDGWLDTLLHHPAYQSLREQGLSFTAQAATWIAPFFDLVPAYSSRIAAWRMTIPHVEGPLVWWAGLAAAALALGFVGNTVLLRPENGRARKGSGSVGARAVSSGRPEGRSAGGGK